MRILLVEDHPIVRDGLKRLFAALPDTAVDEAATGLEAFAKARAERPDLIILDLNLPDIGGLELMRRLAREDRPPRVLVLSMHAEPVYALRVLEAGAGGYVSKSAPRAELLEAIRVVSAGGRYVEAAIAQAIVLQSGDESALGRLSARELEILRLIAEGQGVADIARRLGVAHRTAANACTQLKAKLGLARMSDLVRTAVELSGA